MDQIYSMKLTQLAFPIPTCEYWHKKNNYSLEHFIKMTMDLNGTIRTILKGTHMKGRIAFKLQNGWDYNSLKLVFVSEIHKEEDMKRIAELLLHWLPDWYTTITFHHPWGERIVEIVNPIENVPNIGRNKKK